MVLVALCADLISVKPSDRKPHVPRVLRDSFASLRAACQTYSRSRGTDPNARAALNEARCSYRMVAQTCKDNQESQKHANFLNALGSRDPSAADRIITSLLSPPADGLPDVMTDEDGHLLCDREEILEGAVQ